MNRLLLRRIAWLFAPAVLASGVLAAHGQSPSDDEQTLRSAGLATDGPALLAIVRKHTPSTETRREMERLIIRLGDDSFVERANASKKLFALGRVTLPQLQRASKHEDPEIARRAKRLIERVEREPAHHLPMAALRLLAVRKPPGSVETLLAYLPYAEDEDVAEEVQMSLAALARRDGKPEAALRRALEDSRNTPAVRMRIALALAIAGEREAVPVLIDLLAVLPVEQVCRVEDALYQLAGDSAPQTPECTEPAEKKKCRDAWAAWWKANAKLADLNRFRAQPQLGFTLLCDTGKGGEGRVYEIDRHGKERWAIDKLYGPVDAWVLSSNRVLIAEHHVNRVSERDFKGNILWQKQVNQPVSVQRLPNGNTFIATYTGTILEVDRAGKEIYSITNSLLGVRVAYRSRKGSIVYMTPKGDCVWVDTTGKRLKSFDTKHVPPNVGGIDLSANGRILVTQPQRNKVVEYDAEGKSTLEVNAPQAVTAMSLPNGHILVASYQSHRVYELDCAGKVVWEHKNAGYVFRARRR